MKIYKLEDHKKIYLDERLMALMSQSMFNPTEGRIKSAAEGIYAKEQGRFYIAEQEEIVGILGVRRVDNTYVEIMHFVVDSKLRNKGIGTALIQYMEDVERVEQIIARPDTASLKFFENFGFDVEEKDSITGLVEYICTYNCKR
ncbi:MAG: GNAT family N-acetyltransferase [Clostridia bacterium]|nr:GNAT family N-acetyltransferase [Clostridia bacterium]